MEPSGGLDLHILCRALFRLLYVSSAVYKIVKSGKGLEGSWAENLPLLAGWLQVVPNQLRAGIMGHKAASFLSAELVSGYRRY